MTYSEKLKDPRWQKKRLEILNRDEFKCRECGDGKSTLHVHHIAYSHDPWDVNDSLLRTLCASCHEDEEASLVKSSQKLINELRKSGFGSLGMSSLSKVFSDTDRGWYDFEPSYDIIKMAVDDDEIWGELYRIFFQRLHDRCEKAKLEEQKPTKKIKKNAKAVH